MKKAVVALLCASFLLSGCFITNIFKKKEKYGCPTDPRATGAEKILAGQKVKPAKYKGGKKFVQE
jgi:hypothetical protein